MLSNVDVRRLTNNIHVECLRIITLVILQELHHLGTKSLQVFERSRIRHVECERFRHLPTRCGWDVINVIYKVSAERLTAGLLRTLRINNVLSWLLGA